MWYLLIQSIDKLEMSLVYSSAIKLFVFFFQLEECFKAEKAACEIALVSSGSQPS